MQLCPTATTTLQGDPCFPSRACKYSSGLVGCAYRACGEAASALHAMALLQVHQVKALKDLHEGGHDLAVLHEPAGVPRTTGTHCHGYGRVSNCIGISISSSCWQYALPWAASEGAFRAGTFWSVRSTLRQLRISTDKAVYAPVACRNSPATSSSGVRSIWGPFVPSTSQECSIRQPTSCLEHHFQGSGDSIPRRFSWFGGGSELLR